MIITRLKVSLERFRIGLSGAVPDRSEWTEPAEDQAILEFVALLSGLVFKYGGELVHGSHPTFTPVILRQAELHAISREGRFPITLFMSQLWAKDLTSLEKERLERETNFIVIPKVGEGGPENPDTRNRSLTLMRRQLVQDMNVMVAVGGIRHTQDNLIPGVVEELSLAQRREMACFLVGGFGGMASTLAQIHASGQLRLRNDLAENINEALLTTKDISASVGIIFDQLVSSTAILDRPLLNLPADQL
jgi:hypothetical protein